MKKILMIFILLICSQLTTASEDFCFTGIQGEKSNLTCAARDNLVRALQGGTLALGTVTAVCTWAPEPALTKVSAALVATTGLIINYATFMVRNMPCISSGDYELKDYEETEFLTKMCRAIDKQYNSYTRKCE